MKRKPLINKAPHHVKSSTAWICLPFVGLLLLATGCGDDEHDINRHFFSTSSIPVAGRYTIDMEPRFSNCASFDAVPITYRLSVAQFESSLVIEAQEFDTFRSGSGQLIVDLPPLQGSIFNNGSFHTIAYGIYLDPLSGFEADISWTLGGVFFVDGIEGLSETFFYDPALAGECVVRHDFFGDRS